VILGNNLHSTPSGMTARLCGSIHETISFDSSISSALLLEGLLVIIVAVWPRAVSKQQ
jgi:hypothetical protein